jgi:uncharacterized membrane protein YkvI
MNMFLRTIQFATLLVAAYFFGTYVHQNWVAPLGFNISDPAFVAILQSSMASATYKMPVLLSGLEILIVILLIVQSKDWKSFGYVLTAISFVTVVLVFLANSQTVFTISNDFYTTRVSKTLPNWSSLKARWMQYQYLNGLAMVGVCLSLFTSIFISLLSYKPNTQMGYEAVPEENIPQQELAVEVTSTTFFSPVETSVS